MEFNVGNLVEMPLKPQSKKALIDIIDAFITNLVEGGNHDAVEVYAKLKYAHEICAIALGNQQLRNQALETVGQDHGETSYRDKIRLSSMETGAKYDFSNDSMWVALDKFTKKSEAVFKDGKTARSIRELLLKSIAKSSMSQVVDEKTGEIIYAPKLLKGASTVIKVTF